MEITQTLFLISLGYCGILIILSALIAFFSILANNNDFIWIVWVSEKLSIAFIVGIIIVIITGFIHLITYIVTNNFNHG